MDVIISSRFETKTKKREYKTMLNTKHGVIYYDRKDGEDAHFRRPLHLLTISSGNWLDRMLPAHDFHCPNLLVDFCEVAETEELTHLWIMDGVCTPNKELFENALPVWDLFASWVINDEEIAAAVEQEQAEENLLISVTGCRRPKGGKHFFTLCFPGNCQWSWMDSDVTPKMLLQVVKVMEDAFHVPVGTGPTTVGMKLLEDIHKEQGKDKKKLRKPDVDLAAIPFDKAARTIIWQRPLSSAEKTKQYLHKVDKNSDFLRACLENELGTSNPVHVFNSQGIDENLPGVWHVTRIHPDSASAALPTLLWRDAEWISTPLVKMLQKMGYEVLISEGYQFPTHDTLLEKWARLLWDTRQAFKLASADMTRSAIYREAHERAYDGVKDIAATTVGLFSSQSQDIQKTWKYRPDWWCQVVGQARALMFYNMLKVQKESGLTPLLVYIDAMLFVSDEEDIEKALPGLAIRSSLGTFKHVWTLPLTDEVQGILDSGKGEAQKLGALNDLAESSLDGSSTL